MSHFDLFVFDMDDVLAQLDRRYRLELFASMTDLDPAFLQATIWDSGFETAAEKGEPATGADYLTEFNRLLGSRLSREQWIDARRRAMTIIPGTLQLAEQLRERYEIAMLTNNGPLLLESLPEIVPDVVRIFGDRAHASCQFQARKPEPQVFERLLNRYGVAAERAVFIDDSPIFVEGARSVGMIGIPFTTVAALRQSLGGLGVPGVF